MPIPRETAEVAEQGGRKITVGVRPEDWTSSPRGRASRPIVNLVEELGADAYVYGTADVDGKPYDVIARVDGRQPPEKGESVNFAPKQGHVHLFSTETGERLKA